MIERLLALLILVLISPILLLLLVITTVDLRCNPIYVQKRTVDGTKVFDFYKIRSMRFNAPLLSTYDFIDSDKYITKWGRFIRIYSLDELLNLFCILKGDMKFIGPRPVILKEVDLISLRIIHGINMLPGLTGLAQINGRDLVTLQQKVAYEKLYSLKRRSVLFRGFIILQTIKIVVTRMGIRH